MRTALFAMAPALLLVAGYCAAAPIGPPVLENPTIIDFATAFPGYGVDNVLDGNLVTDYASQGQGINTFIDFDFGQPVTIGQVIVTDRTTSGGGNGFQSFGLRAAWRFSEKGQILYRSLQRRLEALARKR